MEVIERNISELIPAEYNPRYISDEALEQLKASIQRFEAVEPVLVNMHPDRENIIISGHQRIKAAKSLGLKTFPCVELNLDKDKERELNVRMNKNTGAWDWDELATHFDVDELTDWGFSDDELFGADVLEEPESEEDDYEVPDEIETDIVFGDLIEIGEHRLLCGDSTDSDQVAKLMDGTIADMIHTDPPYNIGYEGGSKKREKIQNDKLNDFNQFLSDAYKTAFLFVKEGGAIYVWHASTETHNFIKEFIESGFLFKSYIVWNKDNSTFGRSDYHWKHEPCIYGWKDGAAHTWYGDRKQTTVWDVKRPSRSDSHPTMKPIDLCSIPLQNSSKKGDIVFDQFLGSGSTMVACQQLNRKCYGMELDPKYCQVIIDRMKKAFPELEVKINGEPYEN